MYMKFSDLRTRPALELAMRCGPVDEGLIYDLGCGPGNSAQILAALSPEARIIGVDSSPEMLAQAAEKGPEGATWIEAELDGWTGDERADLIFSNAAYQWLNEHERLLPGLVDQVKPGGKLAIQMPQNFSAPSHVLMRRIAMDGPYRDKLSPILRHDPVGSPADYYDLLAPLVSAIDIWETEYTQILEGDDPVFDWVSGTALMPILAILEEDEKEAFVERYKAALQGAYPRRRDGKTLFAFKRLFILAQI